MKRGLSVLVAAGAFGLSVIAGGVAWATPSLAHAAGDVAFPASRAGRCAGAFVAMVNGKDDASIRDFEKEFRADARRAEVPIEQRIPRVQGVRAEMAPLTVSRVVEGEEVVVYATTGGGQDVAMVIQMSPEQPDRMDGVVIMPASEYQPPRGIDTAARGEIVEAVCGVLEKEYVYPDVAAKMAAHVRGKLRSGAYDSISNEARLAAALSNDLRAISKDKHLNVAVTGQPLPTLDAQAGDGEDEGEPSPEMDAEMARENYAFREVKRLNGNIGYLKFDMFVGSEKAEQTAAAAMTFLSHCDALIVDLRENGGGDPRMIAFLTSYLFDSKVHLNDMVDRDGKVVKEYWTLDSVPGRRPRADVPVYVLTSGFTFSGAEEFCYNLQNLGRALVIGEVTGGGAHPVKGVGARGHVAVRVPYMRACNPVSKTNWEGVGIQPDIKVARADALDRALEEARKVLRQKK